MSEAPATAPPTDRPVSRPRRLSSVEQNARRHSVSARTMRNYIGKGFFPAYRMPGVRGVLLDEYEVDAALRAIPAARAKAGVGSYGPNATIIDLPAQPVIVHDGIDR